MAFQIPIEQSGSETVVGFYATTGAKEGANAFANAVFTLLTNVLAFVKFLPTDLRREDRTGRLADLVNVPLSILNAPTEFRKPSA